jgi:tetratricopeptide (TPR) repeat protein
LKKFPRTAALLFLVFIKFNVKADKYVDSLKQVLITCSSDTSKVITYVNLGYHYDTAGQADSAGYFYKLALALSEKIPDKKFKGMSLYYRGLMLQNTGNYSNAIRDFYGSAGIYIGIKRVKRLGDVYNSIGVTYYYSGQYDSAIASYARAVPYFEKTRDSLGAARCYNNIGIMYDVKGDRVRSVKNYLKAIEIYESNNREDLNTGPYQNIALVYTANKQYPEALKNLEIAKRIAVKYKDDKTLCRILNAIGACLDETGKSDEATGVFNEALSLAEKTNSESLKAITLTNLGTNLLYLKKYKEGEKMLAQCVEIKKRLGNSVSLGISEITLAQAYIKTEKYNEAIASFSEGLKKVREADYKEYQKMALEGLAASYASIKNYKDAYYNLDEFVKINDTLLNESNKKIVTELQTKYETDKKESEIKLLSKTQQLQEVELKRRKTVISFAIGIGLLVFILLVLVFFSWRSKKKANLILADKNKEIQFQRDEIRLQKEVVEEKQKEILDSINYAKRLQEAILPPLAFIQKQFPGNFVLYKPKAIVAGDFYFMESVGDIVVIAVADCTGHGVPGALVSVVCSNALSRCVKEFNLAEPGKILDKTRELVLETFEKSSDDVKDGMDISLAAINVKTKELQWAGANNPLWLLQAGDMKDISATKQPIGKTEKPEPFKTHHIQLSQGDTFYLFTDGYADQFGGPKGKKFKYKPLSDLLLATASGPLQQQKVKLEESFESWKGNLEQVDDVCIIGLRV